MGTATSVVECANRYPLIPPINCTVGSVEFGNFASNPAITGIGTDISFVLTAFLSLWFCSCVQIFCDRLRLYKWRRFFEPLVVSFSDQQIVRGLAMSIATLYTSSTCSIDAYRFNILCYLMVMSITSHLSSVLVLRSYTNGQKVVAVFRFALVFVQIFFAGIIFSSRITGNFPTGVPSQDFQANTTLVLPAVCFQLPDTKPYDGLKDIPKPHKNDYTSFIPYIVLAAFYLVTLGFTAIHVITHYMSPGDSWQKRQSEKLAPKFTWFWWLGAVRGIILGGAWIIWGWSVVKLYQLRKWMNGSGWLGKKGLMDDGEWTFGQLLSIFLMGAAALSLANAWSGYKQNEDDTKEAKKAETEANESARGSTFFGEPESQRGSQYFRANDSESPTNLRDSRVGSGVLRNWDAPRYDESEIEMSPLVRNR